MLEAKAQYAAQLSTLKLQELDAEADIAETKGLYAHDTELARRGGWVVGLQASVRPGGQGRHGLLVDFYARR